MRFLVDAQLPARLARALATAGHDTVHTSELPDGNRSSDATICEVADAADMVVVTKDRDFRNSHLLRGTPRRLLVVATGNVTNDALVSLLTANLGAIEAALTTSAFVEVAADRLVLHSSRR